MADLEFGLREGVDFVNEGRVGWIGAGGAGGGGRKSIIESVDGWNISYV